MGNNKISRTGMPTVLAARACPNSCKITQLANQTFNGFFFTLDTKAKLLTPNVAIFPSVIPFTKFIDYNIEVTKFDVRQAHRADGL